MEILPLDLYFNVQVGAAFSQNAGDHHLELTKPQVSLGFSFLHKQFLMRKFSKKVVRKILSHKMGIIYVVFNCESCTPEICVDLSVSREFPNTKVSQ